MSLLISQPEHTATGSILLVTRTSTSRLALASALACRGIDVERWHRAGRRPDWAKLNAGLVLVDLDDAGWLGSDAVRDLNSPLRRSPLLGLSDGPWPPLGEAVLALRVDGLATPTDLGAIAEAARRPHGITRAQGILH